MQAKRPLEKGETIPDFLLPALEGVHRLFYEVYCGQPTLLLIADRADQLPPASDLPATLQALVLLRSSDSTQSSFLPTLHGAGALCDRLIGIDTPRPCALLLTPQLHLHSRVAPLSIPSIHEAAVTLEQQQQPNIVSNTAPVLMLRHLLPAQTCQRLIAAWEASHHPSSMVRRQNGKQILQEDHRYKRRQDHQLSDPALTGMLNEALGQELLPALARSFHYIANRTEGYKIVAYHAHEGGHFGAHRDNISAQTRHRHFALSINLSDDYEGGELAFPEFGMTRYRPPGGGAIVFSSSLLHKVHPVTAGCRYAALTFLWKDS
ncbi:2OG-Fe(II) oxygenase [Halopseudomonas pelagia]|uniref:2OG-Fe(II) oxygenase n=1 Tax=Halopseudomonas pelagia TaxID=553151 RepID=UPI0003A5D5C1|nr:2OG-Fe(II) oxygenase [Halopseudomonas pelagia]|tara:strand:- start:531 stop:1490 length:960 start_codon:yes stop_codon:yes gene_type:complete